MADPGFPVGGAPTGWGGTNLRRIHFSAKMYAKTKEIDPVGGAAPLDPPMGYMKPVQYNVTSQPDDPQSFAPQKPPPPLPRSAKSDSEVYEILDYYQLRIHDFPLEGADLRFSGNDAKTKELGPAPPPSDPPLIMIINRTTMIKFINTKA